MLALILQLAPFLALILLGTAFGIEALALLFESSHLLPLALLAALAFAALRFLGRASLLSLALLLAFTILLGSITSLLAPDLMRFSWLTDALLTSVVLAIAGIGGTRIQAIPPSLRRVLWGLTWLYFLGWGASAIGLVPSSLRVAWAVFGLALFFGLSTAWFAQAMRGHEMGADNIMPALELFTLGFNLALVTGVLRQGLS